MSQVAPYHRVFSKPETSCHNIVIGRAIICAGFCPERGRHGWHLPGRGFTTDKDRAAEVAFAVHVAMTACK